MLLRLFANPLPRIMIILWALLLVLPLSGCGIKLNEDSAHGVMEKIYIARKKGSFYKEFTYYAKADFKIVPFEEVESTLRTVIGGAGRFKSATLMSAKVSRRNQLGKGLVSYLVLTYEATYGHLVLHESYYFLGSSEIPKLVYMTLQFP